MKQYNLIFLRSDKMLLSNKQYSNWQEIQDEYSEYMASVNFDSIEDVTEYIIMDNKVSSNKAKEQVDKLNTTSTGTIEIEL